ncbi:beta-glucosidase 12-like [Magnolia sinica]|uniref:beta-glucosidase 12-like n=1 Tax=Magnolia sinica TaxID=86752 RepID=UPI00265B6F7E|nr:beta-glucosidase 12-like [Magnolia sinica]
MALLSNVITSMQCPIPSRFGRTRRMQYPIPSRFGRSCRMPIAACMNDDMLHLISRNRFPPDFKFGTATSSFQVEGATEEGGRSPSIWDTFCEEPGKIPERADWRTSNDSYHLYMEDIKIMKKMGFDSYRFSISWPRILPKGTKEGGINQEGINYYKKIIACLQENVIEPFVTLFHWDLPEKLDAMYGGFLNKNIIEPFKDFADVCFQEFGDRVKHWTTMNEPNIFTWLGYDVGKMAPGRCSDREICDLGDSAMEPYIVAHNLILCHAATVELYRSKYQATQKGEIGITLEASWFEPYSSSNPDQQAVERAMDFNYGWFLEPIVFGDYPFSMRAIVKERLPTFTEKETKMIKSSFDFIGLNYYYRYYAKSLPIKYDDEPTSYSRDNYVEQSDKKDCTPIGIVQEGAVPPSVYPRGIKDLVLYVKSRFGNPTIYITENGLGINVEEGRTMEDSARINFHAAHLLELQDALRKGANVKGYFVWSLMDNFEWALGYTVNYGICSIDRTKPSLDRIPKKSADWFAKFLSKKSLE